MSEVKDSVTDVFDIAIVGAGMIGASLALALSELGYQVALLDAQPEDSLRRPLTALTDKTVSDKTSIDKTFIDEIPSDASNVDAFEVRVSAITSASQRFLESLGVWQRLDASRYHAYQGMHVWDELGTASLTFDASDVHADSLGTIVENQALVFALHNQLDEGAKVTRFFGSNLEAIDTAPSSSANSLPSFASAHPQSVLRLTDGRELKVGLVVAADGANSFTRRSLGFETREWDYDHHGIVATVRVEHHHSTAWQRFSEAGPLAFLPIQSSAQGGHYCSIVWSQSTDRAKQLMAMDDTEFLAALSAASEGRVGQIFELSKRFSVPLRQRHAKRYVQSGAALVGDAAHTIHPLAGQGVNQGFKDVEGLVKVLAQARDSGVAPGNEIVLKRYQRQRQGDNLMMMASMEGFKRVFGSSDPGLRLLRNLGFSLVDKQRLLKKAFIRTAMGLA